MPDILVSFKLILFTMLMLITRTNISSLFVQIIIERLDTFVDIVGKITYKCIEEHLFKAANDFLS